MYDNIGCTLGPWGKTEMEGIPLTILQNSGIELVRYRGTACCLIGGIYVGRKCSLVPQFILTVFCIKQSTNQHLEDQ